VLVMEFVQLGWCSSRVCKLGGQYRVDKLVCSSRGVQASVTNFLVLILWWVSLPTTSR
jgi:hypothetical protein